MKVYKIEESCPAYKDYKGSGKAVLVVVNEIPQLIIYYPLNEDGSYSEVNVDMHKENPNASVYVGMCSCYEFVVEKEI